MNQTTVDLAFIEQGQGPALILVHGFPLDRTIWAPVLAGLPNRFRVICPDLRGYGQTPATSGVYGMGLLAADLAALMDRLSLDRAVLAGHSMGGYVSLAFAKQFPQRLAGLAMVTSQAAADAPDRKQGRYQLADRVDQEGSSAVVEASLAKYSRNPDVLAVTKALMLRANPAAVSASLRGMAEREDLSSYLPEIRVPALVIAGEVDDLIASRRSEEMVSQLPQGKLVTVAGGGHMPMLEAPGVVTSALIDLLEQVGE